MWWVVYVILCGVFAAISSGSDRRALLWLIAGLLIVQVFKVSWIGDLVWICFAATWVSIAGAIWRHSVTISSLTLISAMCYPIGRMGGFAFSPGAPIYASPLFWADMALVGAILLAGGPGIVRMVRAIDMDWRYVRRGNSRGRVAGRVASEASR